MKDHITMILYWKSALVPPKSAERALFHLRIRSMRPSLGEWRDYSCCRYNVEVRVPYIHSLFVIYLHCVFSLLSPQ
jgi:hypothetical protein